MLIRFFACLAFALVGAATCAAEPADGDIGLGNLRLGMSFQEAVDALGTRAQKRGSRYEPDMSLAAFDADDIANLIDDILAKAKNNPDAVPRDVLSRCREFKKLAKSRLWRTSGGAATAQIVGSENASQVTVRPSKGEDLKIDLRLNAIDNASMKVVNDFRKCSSAIVLYTQQIDADMHRKDDSFAIRSPDDLYVQQTNVDGVNMQPELFFTPSLSTIRLVSLSSEVESPVKALQVYNTLSQHLSKRFGEPDDATQSETGKQKLWRLPEMIVALKKESSSGFVMQYVKPLPNMAGSTQAVSVSRTQVSISYETPEAFGVSDTLTVGSKLPSGGVMRSLDRRYALQVRGSGSLVVSRAATDEQLWTSNTEDSGASSLTLRDDGNLVLATKDDRVVWASNTATQKVTHLIVQNDGNVVLYNGRAVVWATGTNE